MPPNAWTGYGRFCPLARALDVVGERWTLVIVQELLKRPSRYRDLAARLPGIGTSVLADRLRKLEAAGVAERVPGPVGGGVTYALTDRGRELDDALAALRRWGVTYLTDPAADGAVNHEFDLHYVEGIDALDDAELGLVVDGTPATLRFSRGHLDQAAGEPADPLLTVHTSSAFMDRWAAGTASWDDGRATGEVTLDGQDRHWDTWLAATGYLPAYTPGPDPEPDNA
ncbi:MAG TPA: helix-turn-helix domain-containing protein [Streptosporangiaceae bacterium]|nr:helix-turn-helix domain-containing protein [Streptosporangiaceae bacterium]